MDDLIFYNKEFERAVRDELLIYDRPVTKEDALSLTDLDCTYFVFSPEDFETMSAFENIVILDIIVENGNMPFLEKMKKLYSLDVECIGKDFDCYFISLAKNLDTLTITGSDEHFFNLYNVDVLSDLKKLQYLTFRKIDTLDLEVFNKMPQLKIFDCGYVKKFLNIKSISSLRKLQVLNLISVSVNNVDFVDGLSDKLWLYLSDVEIKDMIDINMFKRFNRCCAHYCIINGKSADFEIERDIETQSTLK